MGYGLYGFSQGLQSGMGMGMQLRQMQWQNEEKKKLELKAEETKNALSDFFGSSFGQTMMTGGNLSQNDKTMFMTALQGATAEARGVMATVYGAWQQGDKETYAREMDRLNILLEYYGNNKFDISNMEVSFESLIGTFTHTDAVNAATAGRNILSSRQESLDTERLNVAVTGAGTGSEAAMDEMNKLLKTDYKAEDVTEKTGNILHEAVVTLNNAAALGKSSFTTVLQSMKLDNKYSGIGIDFENINFDSWTAPEPTTKKPADLKEVGSSVQAIKDAETVNDAQVLANAYIKEHGSLVDLGIEGTDVGKYWGENQSYILQQISRSLDTLVNEKGFVRAEEQTTRNLMGEKQTMSNSEWYQALYNDYMPLYEEMERLGVDMAGFYKMEKLSDITKIEGYAIKGGIKKGDWRPGGWWIK